VIGMKIAFIAALEREVKPLVRNWRIVERDYDGRRYKFFEGERVVLVCGGIGAEAARRATAAVISFYSPQIVWSVGFAGALDPGLQVGDGLRPQQVIDAGDSSSAVIPGGKGTLLSYAAIASPSQKSSLRRAYAAEAVDMEAAAVAHGAQARDVDFAAFKVISDESDFAFPAVERFVRNGQFRQAAFIAYVAIRPWLWPKVLQLARNSAKASEVLSRWLVQYMAEAESLDNNPAEVHPMKRA
jgi:adenosylhomocysteine nucleosidase